MFLRYLLVGVLIVFFGCIEIVDSPDEGCSPGLDVECSGLDSDCVLVNCHEPGSNVCSKRLCFGKDAVTPDNCDNNCAIEETLPAVECKCACGLCYTFTLTADVGEGGACEIDSDCTDINCSIYDGPVKSGFKPYCVDNICKCMCYGCE